MLKESYAKRKLLQDMIVEEFDIKPSIARAWIACMEQDAEHPPIGLNSSFATGDGRYVSPPKA